ncbi:SxtJ family membrane protein [Roseivirga sp.]|uniref:SxtJ family membrane protein n=1 Tax=Roseivirga sp. TaxID=1964215 RepID=UPI003B8E42BD
MSDNRDYNKAQSIVLGLVAGLLAIYFYLLTFRDEEVRELLLIICLIALLSVLSKHVAHYISWVWMKFGSLLGKINGTILLSIVYLIVVTPIGWIKKLVSPGSQFSPKTEAKTAFVERDKTFTKVDIEEPW